MAVFVAFLIGVIVGVFGVIVIALAYSAGKERRDNES